jgi:hypothetical protein
MSGNYTSCLIKGTPQTTNRSVLYGYRKIESIGAARAIGESKGYVMVIHDLIINKKHVQEIYYKVKVP